MAKKVIFKKYLHFFVVFSLFVSISTPIICRGIVQRKTRKGGKELHTKLYK